VEEYVYDGKSIPCHLHGDLTVIFGNCTDVFVKGQGHEKLFRVTVELPIEKYKI
jgi:hypothetical protein